MGKKDKEAMDSMKVEFLAGAKEREVPVEAAEKVWELLLPFAGYAFNKAHAVCYALIAYQTAYLKANYPVEYMAALLEVYREKEDRTTAFIDECRKNKIAVLPPDVNVSGLSFSIDPKVPKGWVGAIRFGLAAIKGVGDKLVEGIIKSRDEEGPFTHFFEFCERAKPHGLNRGALEALVKSGAFDTMGCNRRTLLDQVESALSYAEQAVRQKEAGQDSLFGEGSGVAELTLPALVDGAAPGRAEILAWESETMGIYVSDHPLRGMERTMRQVTKQSCAATKEMEDGQPIVIAGVVASVRTIITKARGEKMATFVLEDFSGQAACTVFAKTYAAFQDLIQKDKILVIKGTATQRAGFKGGEAQIEVKVDDISEFKPPAILDVSDDDSSEGTVIIKIGNAKRDQLVTFRNELETIPGNFRVILEFDTPEGITTMELMRRIAYDAAVREKIQRILGSSSIELMERWDISGDSVERPTELSEAS
jgi:DNA polymerase-3 subunit alpha